MRKSYIKQFAVALFAMLLIGCNENEYKVPLPGEIRHIPFTDNEMIGTDSTIIIIERASGKTLNVIKRK